MNTPDLSNLIELVASAQEADTLQWKREYEALGYVEPPQTTPVLDDESE